MSAWGDFWRECRAVERVVIVGSAAAIVFFGSWLYNAQNRAEALPPLFEDTPASKTTASSTKTHKGTVTVHVAGAVNKPGVLTLPVSARIQDAIRAAGGASAGGDADALNLAAHLEDGSQILVPTHEAAVRAAANLPSPLPGQTPTVSTDNGNSSAHSAANTSLGITTQRTSSKPLPLSIVDINTASAAELQTLPGVGPTTAARIVEARTKRPLRSLDDLDEVKGLGPKKLEKLRLYIRF